MNWRLIISFQKLNMAKDGWLNDTATLQPNIFSHQK